MTSKTEEKIREVNTKLVELEIAFRLSNYDYEIQKELNVMYERKKVLKARLAEEVK